MLVATNLSPDEETRRILEERAVALGLPVSSYLRIMARRTRSAPRSRPALPSGIDRTRPADDQELRAEGVSRDDRHRIASERGDGEDVFRRRRHDRDASPFDRPILGRVDRVGSGHHVVPGGRRGPTRMAADETESGFTPGRPSGGGRERWRTLRRFTPAFRIAGGEVVNASPWTKIEQNGEIPNGSLRRLAKIVSAERGQDYGERPARLEAAKTARFWRSA